MVKRPGRERGQRLFSFRGRMAAAAAADKEFAMSLFQSYYAISSSDGPTGRATPGTVMVSTFTLTCNLMRQLIPEALPSNLPPTLFDDLATDKEFLEECERAMQAAMAIAQAHGFGRREASGPPTSVDNQQYSGGTSEQPTPYLEEVTKANFSSQDLLNLFEGGLKWDENNPLILFMVTTFVILWLIAEAGVGTARNGVTRAGTIRFWKNRPAAVITLGVGVCYRMTKKAQAFAPPDYPELHTTAWEHAYNTTVLDNPYWKFAQPQSFKMLEMIRQSEKAQGYFQNTKPMKALIEWYKANDMSIEWDRFNQAGGPIENAWKVRKLTVDYGPEQVIKMLLKDSMLDFYEREEPRRNILILYNYIEHVYENRRRYENWQSASFAFSIIFQASAAAFFKEVATRWNNRINAAYGGCNTTNVVDTLFARMGK